MVCCRFFYRFDLYRDCTCTLTSVKFRTMMRIGLTVYLYFVPLVSVSLLSFLLWFFFLVTERCVCVFCRQQSEGFVIGDQCGVVLHGSPAVACNQTSDLRQLVIKFTRWSYSLPAPRRCNRRCLSVCLSFSTFVQKLPNRFA